MLRKVNNRIDIYDNKLPLNIDYSDYKIELIYYENRNDYQLLIRDKSNNNILYTSIFKLNKLENKFYDYKELFNDSKDKSITNKELWLKVNLGID
jgi:hypothetical protein